MPCLRAAVEWMSLLVKTVQEHPPTPDEGLHLVDEATWESHHHLHLIDPFFPSLLVLCAFLYVTAAHLCQEWYDASQITRS